MRRSHFALFTGILLLTACNHPNKPDDADVRKAINLYLQTHGKVCTWIGQPFPVDVSESRQISKFGIASKMAVLEAAGLVQAANTMVAVSEPFGGNAQRRVKRYQVTATGQRYLQITQAALGQSAGFCYGTKEVDSIEKWTEPGTMRPALQTEVTYTYKISHLAQWARRADVQNQFDDIRTTITGASKANQMAALELTNQGWEIPAQ